MRKLALLCDQELEPTGELYQLLKWSAGQAETLERVTVYLEQVF